MSLPLRRVIVPVLALTVFPLISAAAQDPRGARDVRDAAIARARSALAPIAAIVGQWEGDASHSRGPGAPMRINQHEDITWGASETILMIKGTGRSPDAAGQGAIVFAAAAVAWFDPELNRVRMQTHTDGRSLVVDLEIRPDTLVWGFDANGGRVRYTIAVVNDTFHEIGEFLRPGAAPIKTLEMKLKRAGK